MSVGHIFEYSSVALSMIGAAFIARRNIRGYLIFIAGFFPSAAFAVYYSHWGMLLLYIYFLLINSYGYYIWRKY